MRVLFDLQSLQGQARRRGMGRYTLGLAKAMAVHPAVTSLEVLLNAGGPTEGILDARRDITTHLPNSRIHMFHAPWPWRHGDAFDPKRHRIAERVRDLCIRRIDPDVVVVGSLFELPFTAVVSIPADERPFTAVIGYDLLPFTEPSCAFPDGWMAIFEPRLHQLANADLILAISDFTASELARVLGPSCPAVETVWGAPGQLDSAPPPQPIPLQQRRGVLCAGGGGGRKNEQSTLRAFAQLPVDLRAAHPLTIQGYRLPQESVQLHELANELGLSPHEYRLLDTQLSEAELAGLLAGARVLTMPSLAEGLGLPVLEAWAAGTPAIGSATTSLGQLIADERWMFDPRDPGHQAAILRPLLTDDAAWGQAQAGARRGAARYTWARSADLAVSAISRARAAAAGSAPSATSNLLTIVAPSGMPQVPCLDGTFPLDELLGDRFEITVTDRYRDSDTGQRLVVVLGEPSGGPVADPALDPSVLPRSVIYAGSASVEADAVGLGPWRALLGYAQDGIVAVGSPGALGVELFRVGLGVIPADEAVRAALMGARSAIPEPMLCPVTPRATRIERAATIADFIESAHRRGYLTSREVGQLSHQGALEDVARNRADRAGVTVYLDAGSLDAVTGDIRNAGQRWVSSLLRELAGAFPGRVMPVTGYQGQLGHDLGSLPAVLGLAEQELPDVGVVNELDARAGDVLLACGIPHDLQGWAGVVAGWKASGGRYAQVVHDMSPLLFEDFFFDPQGSHRQWLEVVSEAADVVICPSGSVAEELRTWLSGHRFERMDGLPGPRVVVVPPGCDMDARTHMPPEIRRRPRGSRKVLVVGALDAHKGLDGVLSAMETLWQSGQDVELKLVGEPGSASSALPARLTGMQSAGRPLTWLQPMPDLDLRWEYLEADLLVAASRCGAATLTIREALAHGLPVLARDLPGFRDALGEQGQYFQTDAELPSRIRGALDATDRSPLPPEVQFTWHQTAGLLASVLCEMGK